MARIFRFAPLTSLLLAGCLLGQGKEGDVAPSSTLPAASAPLAEANALLRQAKFDDAIEKYQQALGLNANLGPAHAGLTRAYLEKRDVQRAFDTVSKGLKVADSPAVHVALGEVYFRQGRITDAEKEWVQVINSGHADARAYLGMARVSIAISLHQRARTMIDKAHELDPSDPDIQRFWIGTLGPSARIQALQDFLAGGGNEDPEARMRLSLRLEYLKARQNGPSRPCRLAGPVANTETKLVPFLDDPTHFHGYGLEVTVNSVKSKLLLDTGASGLLIDRTLAEKSQIERISDTRIGGIGDKGENAGYVGLAKSIRIGRLEFLDCPVEVMDKRSVLGDDGLIGGDVFEDFLLEIDFPNEKLRISELPRPPGEPAPALQLESEEDAPESETNSRDDASVSRKPVSNPLHDRYIAPEMRDYTRVFRFGHMLLVPTKVGDTPPKLFLIDTGAFNNIIAPAAAREVAKVRSDPDTLIKGLSGSVKKVYEAGTMKIQFGRLSQEQRDIVSFDLSPLSENIGTEVSGTLGFAMLRLLDLKIDYRDGLVDFGYTPKPWDR
jgi:tetratricopeptide (TPR) repeat protein